VIRLASHGVVNNDIVERQQQQRRQQQAEAAVLLGRCKVPVNRTWRQCAVPAFNERNYGCGDMRSTFPYRTAHPAVTDSSHRNAIFVVPRNYRCAAHI